MLTKSKYGSSDRKFAKLITKNLLSNVNKQRSVRYIKKETRSVSIMR